MQPRPEHPTAAAPAASAAVNAAAAASASNTTASAAIAVPHEAPIIGVRTLLEFVAWMVSTNAQDSNSKVSTIKAKEHAQPGLAGRKGAMFLMDELSAVGVAVRRMQVLCCPA